MTIPNRTVSIKSVFASTANTTIPNPPAAGVSYRNTGTTAAEIGEGWAFKEIVDSAKFNEAMYEYTTICQQLEKYGFLPWSANTDYPAQGCALGSDGNVYQAKQATGPSSTSIDPTTDTNHTYWDLFYYSSVTASRAIASDTNGKLTASSTTATELGYVHGVTSAIQTQLNNKANNNAVVHLTGTETISGTKTFQGTGWITYIKNTSVTYDTAPSSDTTTAIAFVDKNSQNMGIVECFRNTDNSTVMQLNIYGANGAWASSTLAFQVQSDGTCFARCPTPLETTSTSSKKITNVGWTNTRINNILAALYPVGSIYIGTQSTCPLASLISGSTWTLVGKNRALWGANSTSNANTTIAAGLPNITGKVGFIKQEGSPTVREPSGAFSSDGESTNTYIQGDSTGTSKLNYIKFQASSSNSIYGNSSTVQPPAYVVNVWRRTA